MSGHSQAFGPLHEGHAGAFFPELGYVRQKDKLCILFGQLNETVESGVHIVESLEQLELVERDGQKFVKDGVWIVEGPFQRSDVKNANGRVYSRKIWERLINDKSSVMELVKAGGMIGHLEHPTDGRTHGKEGALVVRDLKLKEDGVVWGKAELLDTPNGKILQEYTRKKVRWGVSSRGNGSVDDSGKVNESDYTVETWDGVMRPSTPGAYPTQSKESTGKVEGQQSSKAGETTTEVKALVADVKALVESSHEGIDEGSQTRLIADLIALSGRVDGLAKSDAMPPSVAYDCRGWLLKKLAEVNEIEAPAKVEEAIDNALRDLSNEPKDRQTEAFNRVVESLQRRVTDAVSEADTLRDKLTETEGLLATRNSERNKCVALLEDAKDTIVSLDKRLEVATDAIARLSTVQVENVVDAAIEEAVSQVPGLSKYKDVLESAESPEQVQELATSLLPAIIEQNDKKPSPPVQATLPTNRPTLPRGQVVSESIKPGAVQTANTSPGATMAGKALSRMATAISQ